MPVYSPKAAELHRKLHRAYVDLRHCPSVYWTKAWCNARVGHGSNHYSIGVGVTQSTHWNDSESVACPCSDKS